MKDAIRLSALDNVALGIGRDADFGIAMAFQAMPYGQFSSYSVRAGTIKLFG